MDKQENGVYFNVQLFCLTSESTVPKWAFKTEQWSDCSRNLGL